MSTTPSEESASSSKKFDQGQQVLCYLGEQIYDAKIEQIRTTEGGEHEYYVHFIGWSSRQWDDWVKADRLLEYTAENQRKQQRLYAKYGGGRKKRKSEQRQQQQQQGGDKDTKVASLDDDSNEEKEEPEEDDEGFDFKIPLPMKLRKIVLKDWEDVSQRRKLVPVPRTPSVDTILAEFLNTKKALVVSSPSTGNNDSTTTNNNNSKPSSTSNTSISNEEYDLYEEMVRGLDEYFNGGVTKVLLCKTEREQSNKILQNMKKKTNTKKKLSEIYGAEHLLRLFVKLPQLLSKKTMEAETKNTLQTMIGELVQYLANSIETFFIPDYVRVVYPNFQEEQQHDDEEEEEEEQKAEGDRGDGEGESKGEDKGREEFSGAEQQQQRNIDHI